MKAKELKYYLDSIGCDASIKLLAPISDNAGFFATEGKLVYMSLDTFGYSIESIDTDFLQLQTHVPIHAVDNSPTFDDGYYNIIVYKGSLDDENADSFVELCVLHANHTNELAFRDFFYALISIFQLPRDQSYKNAVGLYGELKFMQYIANAYNIDISSFWHKSGSLSRFDFSNGNIGIEIKSTSSEDSNISIKHNQIFGDFECYLVTVECEQIDIGESLFEVANAMKQDGKMFNNLNFSINLEKELKRISPQQIKTLRLQKKKISMFNASDINPFTMLPDSVSNLCYELDVSELMKMPIEKEGKIISEFSDKGV